MLSIVREHPDDHWLIWHDLEDERRAIQSALPTAVSVYGSQDLDAREQAIVDFSDGKIQYLSAKPVIAGSGCNFQRFCNRAVFLGVGFKVQDFISYIPSIAFIGFAGQTMREIHVIHRKRARMCARYRPNGRSTRTCSPKWAT